MTIFQTYFRWSRVIAKLSMHFLFFQLKDVRVLHDFPSPCCSSLPEDLFKIPCLCVKEEQSPVTNPITWLCQKLDFFLPLSLSIQAHTVLHRSFSLGPLDKCDILLSCPTLDKKKRFQRNYFITA